MKTIGQVAGKVLPHQKPAGNNGNGSGTQEGLEDFLAERFPEVSEIGRRSLIKSGLTIHGAREVDAVRHKIENDPSKKPQDPGALWFTYLKAKTGQGAQHAQ